MFICPGWTGSCWNTWPGRPVAESIAALDPESRKNIGASVMHELQRFQRWATELRIRGNPR